MEDVQEKQLYDELFDNQRELTNALDALISAKWDSPTLKKDIVEYMDKHWKINHELRVLEEKNGGCSCGEKHYT